MGVERDCITFHLFRKNFVRTLELQKVDRHRATLLTGHERSSAFRVFNPEGVTVARLLKAVEAVGVPGLNCLNHLTVMTLKR